MSSSMACNGRMLRVSTALIKTLYNRFVRWSRMGIFDNIFAELAKTAGNDSRLMIDATHLKAHRTAVDGVKGRMSF